MAKVMNFKFGTAGITLSLLHTSFPTFVPGLSFCETISGPFSTFSLLSSLFLHILVLEFLGKVLYFLKEQMYDVYAGTLYVLF
jgi:hypothetical protein